MIFNKPMINRTRVVHVSLLHWELAMVAKANSIKAFLFQIIKPLSHDMGRRRNFQPKLLRFCLLNVNRTNEFGVAS
ncbi:hypothetical protein REPUB_Repub15cG0090300 [Reevesia pubescens]